LFACAVALLLIIPELLNQTHAVTLEEALKVRESRFVEFKGSLYWDIKRNEYVEERKLDVLKSIAGFLNVTGGTLFIGVLEEADSISVRGLNENLARVAGSTDRLQLMLRDLITTRIGYEFSPLITDGLEEKDGTPYWRITIAESPEPAFVRWKLPNEQKEQKKFYVREGPRTSDLDNESTWHYIKNKWGRQGSMPPIGMIGGYAPKPAGQEAIELFLFVGWSPGNQNGSLGGEYRPDSLMQ
jgi:predicted HTH transcriptional regulator